MPKRFLLFLFIFQLSCVNSSVYTEVKVNDQYTLTVPDYLHPCTDLSKKASLQLQSIDNDVYLIVIDEKKATLNDFDLNYNLKTYFNTIIQQPFIKDIRYPVVEHFPKEIKINNYNVLMSSITGMVNNRYVYYKLVVIETPHYFYQLVLWTRYDNKKNLENELMKITESFREENKLFLSVYLLI